MTTATTQTGYAQVNGLNMYYEIHGAGEPLVVIHGAYMNIDAMGALLHTLAQTRQVIAVELQGHGRTADIDRPFSFENFADDVAALIRHLGIQKLDVVGYSMGGNTALQLAIRHPDLVGNLVAMSVNFRRDGYYPEVLAMMEGITPEMFAGSPMETEFVRLSPNPDTWPQFVAKLTAFDAVDFAWPPEMIRSITVPTLLVFGDNDVITPEHMIELFRLLGGGGPGDMGSPLPTVRLAILPATSHITVLARAEIILPMITEFFAGETPNPFGM